jgi:hypothetical protein
MSTIKQARPLRPRKWAGAVSNPQMMSVDTWSGYRVTIGDPAGPQHDFRHEVSDEELGAAVLDCLSHSRFLDTPELQDELFHPDAAARSYASWIERLMRFCGYKTKRALFKDMLSCSIEQEDGTITIRPSRHEKLEAWSAEGFTDADNVVIRADAPPGEIGAALREALRRCV